MNMKKIRNDFLIILIVLSVAVIFHLSYKRLSYKSAEYVCIYDQNVCVLKLDLAHDHSYMFVTADGHFNQIIIQNAQVSVTDADCTDKICVRHKSISYNGESIICLPHKMVVTISGKDNLGLDGITY